MMIRWGLRLVFLHRGRLRIRRIDGDPLQSAALPPPGFGAYDKEGFGLG